MHEWCRYINFFLSVYMYMYMTLYIYNIYNVMYVHGIYGILVIPRAHAQSGVKQLILSVCPSVSQS